MNTDIYERIEDYLLGRLSPEASKAFELSLEKDEALAEAVELQRQIIEASSEAEVLSLRRQLRKQFSNQPQGISGRPWILAIISILAVLLLLYYFVPRSQSNVEPNPTEEQVPNTSPEINTESNSEFLDLPSDESKEPIAEEGGEQPISPDDSLDDPLPEPSDQNDSRYIAMATELYDDQPYSVTTIRSESDVPATDLEKAAEAYRDSFYQQVLSILQNSAESSSSEALKLQAHALFQLGAYPEAAILFESLRTGFYRYDADWFQFLCYLANLPESQSDYDAKRSAILEADGHPFAEKVGGVSF